MHEAEDDPAPEPCYKAAYHVLHDDDDDDGDVQFEGAAGDFPVHEDVVWSQDDFFQKMPSPPEAKHKAYTPPSFFLREEYQEVARACCTSLFVCFYGSGQWPLKRPFSSTTTVGIYPLPCLLQGGVAASANIDANTIHCMVHLLRDNRGHIRFSLWTWQSCRQQRAMVCGVMFHQASGTSMTRALTRTSRTWGNKRSPKVALLMALRQLWRWFLEKTPSNVEGVAHLARLDLEIQKL